ncbi:MAG: hypothetical protein MJ059_01445 [Lachnospiraceae bacterium]|nr:hypothetical protein [Lachnospiraceae bacterium]
MAFDAVAVLVMALFAFYINRNVRVSGLYMDDLYLWSCYGEQSFKEFVFPAGSTRFRPVFWMAAYVELAAIGTKLNLIVPINLIILTLITAYCYFFMVRLSKSRCLSFVASIAIIASTFSYYDVSQLLGLLESLSMFFALLMCIKLFIYKEEKKEVNYILAVISYLLVCFTHERYMVLIPMFYYVLIVMKDRKKLNYMLPAIVLIFVILSRYAVTGTLLPAGTGGTKVEETFTLMGFWSSIKCEIKYLLGFNAGPEYLCGLEWQYVSRYVKAMVYMGICLLTALAVMFLIRLYTCIRKKGAVVYALFDEIYFAGFIIGCVAASSVTIRVEMRWIYTSFVFLLFIIAYAYGFIRKYSCGRTSKAALICAVTLCVLFISENIYYRGYWGRIYLFPNQERYNSLADVTYGKYGEEIFGKDIYIIGNSYEMSEFTGETFFKIFDPDRNAEGTHVYHVDDVTEIPMEDNVIILREDPENNAFAEVR